MDDDDVQDTIHLDHDTTQSKTLAQTASDEAPPNKPPRPVSQQHMNEQTLKEAFPAIDLAVIRAVLIASGGQIDPAFNALLGRRPWWCRRAIATTSRPLTCTQE